MKKERKYYAKKITTRLTQEDVDFINAFARGKEVEFRPATRMLMELSRRSLECLTDGTEAVLVRGVKVPYVNKLTLWVTSETAELIDRLAEQHVVPKQEASRFLIRLAELHPDVLMERTNFFIIR